MSNHTLVDVSVYYLLLDCADLHNHIKEINYMKSEMNLKRSYDHRFKKRMGKNILQAQVLTKDIHQQFVKQSKM